MQSQAVRLRVSRTRAARTLLPKPGICRHNLFFQSNQKYREVDVERKSQERAGSGTYGGQFRTLSLCALALLGTAAHAQSERAGTWEIGGTLLDLSSVSAAGANGSGIEVDDETGFGFSGAYNLTNRFAVGLDVSYSDPQYVATLVPDGPLQPPEVINAELGVDVIHFKGIWYVLDQDLTPFLEVGAGWTYIDSNIIEGISGSTVCWWDPWWGYSCPIYFDTYTDTRTSLSYAVGIRWDPTPDIVLRASWGQLDIDTDRSEDIELDTIQVTVGWKF
jgi:opacity protein-like surface antigen